MGSYHWPEIGYLMHPGMSFVRNVVLLLFSSVLSSLRLVVTTCTVPFTFTYTNTPPPAHAGKGYATEALHAYLAAYFAHVPSPTSTTTPGALGFDYVQAETDAENIASQKVLLKSGFQLVEKLVNAFDSPALGVRDTLVYKIARPGMTLEGLGLVERPVRLLEVMGRAGPGGREEEFVPPVQ